MNDINILVMELEFENIIKETKIPSLAESMVPAVVGETNLFWVICCIIRPLILIPMPATIMLISSGFCLKAELEPDHN